MGLVVQELDNRRYRVVYLDGDSVMEIVGTAEACESCTSLNQLHVSHGDRSYSVVSVAAIREVWTTDSPEHGPHPFEGERRVF